MANTIDTLIYKVLKLHISFLLQVHGFTILIIYKVLKHDELQYTDLSGFTILIIFNCKI